MSGETFYQWFKDVLRFFDLGWGEKDKLTLWVEGEFLIAEYEDRQLRHKFKPPKPPSP